MCAPMGVHNSVSSVSQGTLYYSEKQLQNAWISVVPTASEAAVIITFSVCIHRLHYFLFMMDSVYIETVIQSHRLL